MAAALPQKDLIHETSTTTGTIAFTTSAVNGKVRFGDSTYGFGTTALLDQFDYYISNRDAAEWERGTGHCSALGTLVRDTVTASSNANALVSFSAGTKDVTNDIPASLQVRSASPTFSGTITMAVGSVTDATDATSSSAGGAFTIAGGLAVAKKLFVGLAATIGGILKTTDTTQSTSTTTGSLQAAGGLGIAKDVNVGGDMSWTGVAFTTYTPSVSLNAGSGTLTLVNARYKKFGKLCVLFIRVQLGGSSGTDRIDVTAPAGSSGVVTSMTATLNGRTPVVASMNYYVINTVSIWGAGGASLGDGDYAVTAVYELS